MKAFYPFSVNRSWYLPVLIALLCLAHGPVHAQVKRYGVLLPEDQQRQKAVKAAPSGADEPLVQPKEPISEPKNPDSSDSEIVSELQKKTQEALAPVTLDEKIQSQSLKGNLKQFGYDIFSAAPTTFAPVENIPVPLDYLIGPGDTFTVQVFGPADVEYRLVVTREGRLLVPEVGALQLAGMSFEEAKTVIGEAINRIRVGVKTVVTLADLHTIQVILVGDVEKPGAYTVSGLSSLLNTLITTGGVKHTGSLRDIQVRRNNQVIAHLDVYDVLLNGQSKNNIYLRHGDVIFAPPIGPTVGVAGEVNRPAIYELKNETTLDSLIKLAGGLLPTASRNKPQIRRISNQGGFTLIQADLDRQGGQTRIANGDLVRIFPVLNKIDNAVLLSGNVLEPGGFQWRSGMRVSDLINTSDTLRQKTEFDVAVIFRENNKSKRQEVIYFDLGQALGNKESGANILLRPRDEVIIFSTDSPRDNQLGDIVRHFRAQSTEADPPKIVDLKGYSKNPGFYPLQLGSRLLDLIKISGGIQIGLDMNYSLMVRRNSQSGQIEFTQINLRKALDKPDGDHNPVLTPGDRIYLFDDVIDRSKLIKSDLELLQKQTRFGTLTPIVEISGKIHRPGAYPLVPGMRIRDLIDAGGGMLEDAYGQSATLSRQVSLNEEFQRTDHMEINLISNQVMLNNTSMTLEPYDQLTLREKPEWISTPKMITISGEVKYPGTYRVDKRETMCGVIQRAGGFTRDAYLFGSVFLRESVRKREQEAIEKISNELEYLLAQVHVSPGYDKDKKLPTNLETYNIFKVIKELKPKKAAGRIVIDMQKAVERCNEESDIALENGDKIMVPKFTDEVSVMGEVYFPTSHKYREDRAAIDYINLSGGTKELAMREHAYIVQANGEVLSLRSPMSTWGWLLSPSNVKVTPGSTVYVPLSVDRINGREFAQSWLDLFYKLSISAASTAYLFK